jgi:hypothetical protein
MITEPSADSEVAKLIAATAKPVKVSKTVLGDRPDDADDDTTYFRIGCPLRRPQKKRRR